MLIELIPRAQKGKAGIYGTRARSAKCADGACSIYQYNEYFICLVSFFLQHCVIFRENVNQWRKLNSEKNIRCRSIFRDNFITVVIFIAHARRRSEEDSFSSCQNPVIVEKY